MQKEVCCTDWLEDFPNVPITRLPMGDEHGVKGLEGDMRRGRNRIRCLTEYLLIHIEIGGYEYVDW